MSDAPDPPSPPASLGGRLAAAWGVGGVLLLLGSAVWRLGAIATPPLRDHPGAGVWLAYGLSVLFMGYAEGYRGFQKAFSPRVVARALHLARTRRVVDALLAPLFCMGHFGATRRRKISAWCLTLGIVGLVLAVRAVPQPWRGAIDAGVVVGLAWGVVAILAYAAVALAGRPLPVPPDVAD